jgi:hemoglobin
MRQADTGASAPADELHPETRRLLNRRGFLTAGAAGAAVTFLGMTVIGCASKDSPSGGGVAAASPGTTAKATTTTTAAPAGPAGTVIDGKTLYQRLGGNPAITAVIGTFLGNVAADNRINHFFANVDLARLKELLIEQVGMATGGPEQYGGRTMKDAHAGLKITVADFNALVEDLVKALDAANVPAEEKTELLNLLAPLQSDIVTA